MAACFQSALVTKELRNGSRAMPSAPSPPRSRQHRPRSLASDQTSAMQLRNGRLEPLCQQAGICGGSGFLDSGIS